MSSQSRIREVEGWRDGGDERGAHDRVPRIRLGTPAVTDTVVAPFDKTIFVISGLLKPNIARPPPIFSLVGGVQVENLIWRG